MNISIDLGNKYVKAVSGDGRKVIFRSVISTGSRRHVLSLGGARNEPDTDALQVQVTKPDGTKQDYYIGKMAERFGTMCEYVLGKERYSTESALILVHTAAALLSPNEDEPVSLNISIPYDQYERLGNDFCEKVKEYQATLDIAGIKNSRRINIQSVTPYEQGLSALYNMNYKEPLLDDNYYAVIDIGGGTTEVIVAEVCSNKLIVHEELSGTFSIGTKDISNAVRVAFRKKTGDTPGADVTEQIIFKHGMFYNGKELDFVNEVELGKERLASTIKTHLLELWGETKGRIRHVFYVGGGAELIRDNLAGFHESEEVVPNAQFANAEGGLTLLSALSQPASPFPSQAETTYTTKQPVSIPETVPAQKENKSIGKHEHVANNAKAGNGRVESVSRAKEEPNNRGASNYSSHSKDEYTKSEKERTDGPQTEDHIDQKTTVPNRFVEGKSAWNM